MTSGGRTLAGKVALVTGGSRGIGEATCLALAGQGADVVLTYRSDRAAAEDVARRCGQHGGPAVVAQADLSTVDGAVSLAAEVAERAPQVDVVVSNAAAPFPFGPLSGLDAETLGRKAAADLGVLHTLATAFLPDMRERGFGRLLVISSVHALGPTSPGVAAHGIAKAALEAYVRWAADELGGDQVTVNALQLGFVPTASTAGVPPLARDLLTATTPAGRLSTPADIAAGVCLLAQPSAGWINGAIIPAAGGLNYPLNLARVLAQVMAEPQPSTGDKN